MNRHMIDDTRYCPMCEDAAKKILELEQRVKVLTMALTNIMDDQRTAENRYVFLTAKHALFPPFPKESKE